MASYNRAATTLRCLRSIASIEFENAGIVTEIFLLDDASTDGTAEAVQAEFPDVTLLQGTGTLFWGGGMSRAMAAAFASDPDFVLLLNDDVVLYPDSIASALDDYAETVKKTGNQNSVIIGAVIDPTTHTLSYSGFKRTSRRDPTKLERVLPAGSDIIPCDTMNGNFVLLPRAVWSQVGTIDPVFVHQLGDIDYGYRVVKAGGCLWVARRPVGTCARNHRVMPFRQQGLGLLDRWRKMNDPLGLPLRAWITFMWRWGGIIGLARLGAIYTRQLIRN